MTLETTEWCRRMLALGFACASTGILGLGSMEPGPGRSAKRGPATSAALAVVAPEEGNLQLDRSCEHFVVLASAVANKNATTRNESRRVRRPSG